MSNPTLPKSEYQARVRTMQALLREHSLDAVIIAADEAEPANVRYFTNYTTVFETVALLIPEQGEPLLLTGPETVKLVELHSEVKNYAKLLEFRESSDPEYPDIEHDTFDSVLGRFGGAIRRLGLVGGNVMTVQAYQGLMAAASGVEVVRADELLRGMRMIKTANELDMMRHAAKIAQSALAAALSRIQPGMTELEVSAECAYQVVKHGAESPGFLIWCVSGPNTNQAIGKSTRRVIQKNEVVQITMGAMYEGYVASHGRPFCFGQPSDKAKRMLELGLEANKKTHSMIKAGVNAGDIARGVHDFIRSEGFGDYIVYGPGHGTGMMECEYPFIESVSDYLLQPNMTFAIDTFLGGEDFGMRYEDAVAVTSGGEEQFSRAQTEVIVL